MPNIEVVEKQSKIEKIRLDSYGKMAKAALKAEKEITQGGGANQAQIIKNLEKEMYIQEEKSRTATEETVRDEARQISMSMKQQLDFLNSEYIRKGVDGITINPFFHHRRKLFFQRQCTSMYCFAAGVINRIEIHTIWQQRHIHIALSVDQF